MEFSWRTYGSTSFEDGVGLLWDCQSCDSGIRLDDGPIDGTAALSREGPVNWEGIVMLGVVEAVDERRDPSIFHDLSMLPVRGKESPDLKRQKPMEDAVKAGTCSYHRQDTAAGCSSPRPVDVSNEKSPPPEQHCVSRRCPSVRPLRVARPLAAQAARYAPWSAGGWSSVPRGRLPASSPAVLRSGRRPCECRPGIHVFFHHQLPSFSVPLLSDPLRSCRQSRCFSSAFREL